MTTGTATPGDVAAILEKYPDAGREALIPLLQDVQEEQGYISREAIKAISKHLGLPTSKIYGVATFYNQFRFEPRGKYHIQICRGTACHVKGSATVLEVLTRELKLEAGHTSRDGMFSLEVVACIGACGLAPVMSINGVFYAGLTPKKVREILDTYREGEVQHDHVN